MILINANFSCNSLINCNFWCSLLKYWSQVFKVLKQFYVRWPINLLNKEFLLKNMFVTYHVIWTSGHLRLEKNTPELVYCFKFITVLISKLHRDFIKPRKICHYWSRCYGAKMFNYIENINNISSSMRKYFPFIGRVSIMKIWVNLCINVYKNLSLIAVI